MDRDQDVEVELYEENVGNLNYSTPTGSRSSYQDRFLPVLSSQEPTQRRLEENPFVAIDPRPDPEDLSHAPTSQVPRIHDSCHIFRKRIFKFGVHIGRGQLLPPDHKLARNWAWPGDVTQFRNFWTPSIFRKRKKLRSSNLART